MRGLHRLLEDTNIIMNWPKVSIIIPTLNREGPLIDTIKGALAQDYANYEVIVVDQTDQHLPSTIKMLELLVHDARLKIVAESEKSLPNARNVGIRGAAGEFIVFIDDDVLLPVDFVTQHYTFMVNYGADAVGGRVLQHNRAVLSIPIRFNAFSRIKGDGFAGQEMRQIDTFRGCNMAFHRRIFDQFGYFDIHYTTNATREESDLALRIKKGGIPILFNPKAVVTHLEDQGGGCNNDTKTTKRRFESDDFFKNDCFFFLKYFHKVFLPIYIAGMYKVFVFNSDYTPRGLILRQSLTVAKGMSRAIVLYFKLRLRRSLLT
jgi:glycosyltransferase involved in cell wall biosynthesis